LITASNLWKVFASEAQRNSLIYDKCKPLDAFKSEQNNTYTQGTLHWGVKYEPVSIHIYEHMYQTKVGDFGCIQHKTYQFIGASPDGINVCPLSRLYGRMLEIKNVVSRIITGIPKEDYWIQMQIQMEVCRLPECDFLETKFVEYEDERAFDTDSNETNDETNWNYTLDGKRRGVIVCFIKGDKPFYQYAPLGITTKKEFEQWFEKIIHTFDKITWIKNIYWRLEVYSCVLVVRDKEWFKKAVVKIEELWKIVETEKVTGCEHRAPKRRVVKKNDKNETTQLQTKIEVNEDGSVALISVAGEKICHSGLFF
jgi:hypothetical protein